MINVIFATIFGASAAPSLPIEPAVLARAKAIYAQRKQWVCQRDLETRTKRAAWLNPMSPKLKQIFAEIEGPTLAQKPYKDVMDASHFKSAAARPVMISGRAAEGKTLHLQTFVRALVEHQASVFSMSHYDLGVYRVGWTVAGIESHRNFDSRRPLSVITRDIMAQISEFARRAPHGYVVLDVSQILEDAGTSSGILYAIAQFLDHLDELRTMTGVHLLVSLHAETVLNLEAELSARAFAKVMGRYLRLDLAERPADPYMDQINRLIPREFHHLVR